MLNLVQNQSIGCAQIQKKKKRDLCFHMNTGSCVMYAELVDTDTGVVLFTSSQLVI